MKSDKWRIHNSDGPNRVVVTKDLPGRRWLEILTRAGYRVEICTGVGVLNTAAIKAALGARCDAVIGQLTESWGADLFKALKEAGGRVYSNYAVGYNNVDVTAATRCGIPVGNTPGVLTQTTAEMAVALTLAAARRLGEAERFMRAGHYQSWLPTLFLGRLLHGKTLGVIGAGRIGSAYARIMVEGFKMDLVYFSPRPNKALEDYMAAYADFLQSRGQAPVTCRRAPSVEYLLETADCVSLHTVLDPATHHLIDARRLGLMKSDAVLVNTSRGPVIDEAALVAHCRANPDFSAGLDVYEKEPAMHPGLDTLENVVVVPHIASATRWTREGMATLAAANAAGVLLRWPAWQQPDTGPFLQDPMPEAAPSIVNAAELGYPVFPLK